LDRQLVNAHSLIEQTLAICRDDIAAGHIKLDLDFSAAEHHVLGDPARLQQILWNLIKNAVKFTPPAGRLSIRTRNEDAPDESSRCRLIVDVCDTGIGIEPELLPKVFHAFEQGQHINTRQFGGLGLGLAISQSLAKMHGGRLNAISAGKGQGATFTLDLETSPRPVGVPPATAPTDRFALSSNVRILLVEDNADTLNVLARLLRRLGYRVTTASSVSAALEATSGTDYDVVISDLGLPDGSGLDVMRNIQNQGTTKGIALSGYGMDEDKLRSQEAGFVAHLTKPVDFQKLEEMIQKVVSRHEREDVAHLSEVGGH
jgi:CheY-like chemotaxis protein